MPFPSGKTIAASLLLSSQLLADTASDLRTVLAALRSGDTSAALANLHGDLPVDQPVAGDGSTLLHAAARHGDPEPIRRLLDLGASPAKRDRRGNSALHYLAETRDASRQSIRLLLADGQLLVDDLNQAAQTPLHVAVARKNPGAAAAFLEAGADPDAADRDAATPRSLALRRGPKEIADLLQGAPLAPPPPRNEPEYPPSGYPAPDLSLPLFDPGSLTLPQKRRGEILAALVSLARDHPNSDLVDHVTRAKALAVALGIDRRNRDAVVADAQLRLGVTPEPKHQGASLLHTSAALGKLAGIAGADAASDGDRRLAALLADIAAGVDPTISVDGLPPADWRGIAGITPPPPPAPPIEPPAPAPPLQIAAASLRALVTDTSAPPAHQLVDITSKAYPRPPHAARTAARFDSPAGNALARAVLASQALGAWPEGYQFVLSLPPQTNPSDAAAAGLAVALLVASHTTSQPLDPNIAAVAGVTPEGELVPVDDLQNRLRTAVASGCKTAIIASASAPQLADSAILGDTALVRDLQILVAPDLQTAFAIATASPPYAAASAEFLLLQALTSSGRLPTQEAITRLRGVASSARGHLSASLLVAAATGRLPKQLTPGTSAAKIRTLAEFLTSKTNPKQGFPPPGQFVPEQLAEIRSVLTRHRPMLAPATRAAADATNDLATLLEKFHHAPPRSGDGTRRMATTLRDATRRLASELAQLEKLEGS